MAEQINNIMDRILKKFDLEKKIYEKRLIKDWQTLMGKDIAIQCKPVRIEGSTLFLIARNKVWRSELASNHDQLVNLVIAKTGIPGIKKIIFIEEE